MKTIMDAWNIRCSRLSLRLPTSSQVMMQNLILSYECLTFAFSYQLFNLFLFMFCLFFLSFCLYILLSCFSCLAACQQLPGFCPQAFLSLSLLFSSFFSSHSLLLPFSLKPRFFLLFILSALHYCLSLSCLPALATQVFMRTTWCLRQARCNKCNKSFQN